MKIQYLPRIYIGFYYWKDPALFTRLHDVPRVFPPGESGQNSELDAHQAQADPGQIVGPALRLKKIESKLKQNWIKIEWMLKWLFFPEWPLPKFVKILKGLDYFFKNAISNTNIYNDLIPALTKKWLFQMKYHCNAIAWGQIKVN